MKRYIKFVKGNWIFALLSTVFILIDVYLEMKLPMITAKIIDDIIPNIEAVGNLTECLPLQRKRRNLGSHRLRGGKGLYVCDNLL